VPDVVVAGGSAAEKVKTFTKMPILGLDPRPNMGRSLIARGEAGMEASVRKTLGATNSTAGNFTPAVDRCHGQ
jgi:hypothetical protein